MIPGDGRIVGKANAKADNRPHADLLPQKSSDKFPILCCSLDTHLHGTPKTLEVGTEILSPIQLSSLVTKACSAMQETTYLMSWKCNAMQEATFLMSWRCSALQEAAFLMSKKCSAMQEATFLLSWKCSTMQEATFLMSWKCGAMQEATFLMSWKCSTMQEATFLMSWQQAPRPVAEGLTGVMPPVRTRTYSPPSAPSLDV